MRAGSAFGREEFVEKKEDEGDELAEVKEEDSKPLSGNSEAEAEGDD